MPFVSVRKRTIPNSTSVSVLFSDRPVRNFGPMIQQILVALIFAAALYYVGRLIYKSFQAKSACTTGCGKCGAVDFKKIEEQLKKQGL